MLSVVTGATGCLGFALTKRLLNDGHQVIALGRNPLIGASLKVLGAHFIQMDLADFDGLKHICKNADFLFHCAALSSPWGKYHDFYNANVQGTRHVVHATPSKARLIHVSTPSIYFDFTEKHNILENSTLPVKPANYYVQTKLIAENIVDNAGIEQKLQAITIRPRGIFGPNDRAIFPRLLQAERKGILPLVGTGENIIDITYVDNVVESMVLAAHANEQYIGKKYNITNDDPRALIDIIQRLYRSLNKTLSIRKLSYFKAQIAALMLEHTYRLARIKKEPRLTRYTAAVLAKGQTLNIDAAKKDLQYRPKVSIDEGIQRFADWYRP